MDGADIVLRGYGGYTSRLAVFLLKYLFPLPWLWYISNEVHGGMAGGNLSQPFTQGSAKPPTATTVFFGANEAALAGRTSDRQHVPTEEYKENLGRIVHHLKNQQLLECSPAMLVVLIIPPPIDEEGRMQFATSMYGKQAVELPERTDETAGVYARQCVQLARELGLPSFDVWAEMQETKGWLKLFLSDGLHLTAEGNAVVLQEVERVLKESGLAASEIPM